jgi:subfamily B ATP-binding cassette protein MsbA
MAKQDTKKVSLGLLKKTYLRLVSYALNYKWILLISIVSIFVLASTNAGFLALIKKITDEGLVQKNQISIYFLPTALFFIMLIRAVSNFLSNYSLRWVSRKVVEDLRYDIFKNTIFLPATFFDNNATGSIVSKITMDTEQLSDTVTKVALDTIRDSLTLIAVVGYMFYLDWVLTLSFLIIIPIIIFYIKKVSPKLRATGNEAIESWYDMVRTSEESVSGQRIIKIFGTAKYELDRFYRYAIRYRKMQTKLARLSGSNSFVVEIVSGIALALIVFYSLIYLSAGEFAAYATALVMLLNPIRKLTQVNEQIQVGYSYASSVFSLIDEEKENDFGNYLTKKTFGNITFNNVTFSYPKEKKEALSKVSFQIKSGEKVALVGKSGGGKTTIINLIPLLYKFSKGEILIDGVDIRQFKLSNLRHQISMVSQDIILFNESVANNIGYGKKYSLQRIKAAAKAANASEFIDKLPHKYNHIIGDRGVKLSGGQKQRIAIARAILKNAPILLLDEATSALDSESEKLVQKALDNLMKNKTSIVVAHRLSTVINADKIIVIDDGRVKEVGKHKQLLAKKGYYTKLYQKGFN